MCGSAEACGGVCMRGVYASVCIRVWLVVCAGGCWCVCCGGGDTALACVCDARGVVGGVACACGCFGGAEEEHARRVVRAWSVLLRVLGAACGWDARVCVVDRVVRSGWFVCICVDTRCAGSSGVVCGGVGSVWLGGGVGCGGAREGGRSGGGVVCVVRALRWFEASLTYVGVFAGRQVGGIGQS